VKIGVWLILQEGDGKKKRKEAEFMKNFATLRLSIYLLLTDNNYSLRLIIGDAFISNSRY
jgi:hypothetical protein